MRRLAMLVIAFAVPVAAQSGPPSWTLRNEDMHIGFKVAAVGMGDTEGAFGEVAGRIALDIERPERSRLRFTVAVASIDAGSDGVNAYLKSGAMFDAARYPDIVFVSTAVARRDDSHALVTGDLTVHGVTKPLVLDVAVERLRDADRDVLRIRATGVVHRLEYGIDAAFPAVSNDIRLTVTSVASRPVSRARRRPSSE